MKTLAAILVESREELVVDQIEVPPPGVGQALVKIHYTTICGAQINEIDAVKGPDKYLPHLLGHEASGIVEEIGPGVSHVKPGDHVVLHWRPGAGIQAEPASYDRFVEVDWSDGIFRDPRQRINAGWITTLQEYAVVSENRVTRIPPDFDMKIAPLLGCAVTTAAGVVANDANVKIGDSVAVFGAGGVGMPIVKLAAMAGAYPIVVVEPNPVKRRMAEQYGATHTLHPVLDGLEETLLHGALRFWGRAPNGFDKVIETTGTKDNIELAYELTAPTGTCVLVGVPSEKVSIYTLPIHLGKTLTGSEGGGCHPEVDIPRIIMLVQAGRLSLDGMITHEFSLDKINDALALMRTGTAGRICIKM